MRIGEIASNAEFWIGEQFQNLTIFKVKFWFLKFGKNSINLLILHVGKLGNFLIFHFGKLGNLLIFHFGKLQKFPKFYNSENHKISTIDKLIK